MSEQAIESSESISGEDEEWGEIQSGGEDSDETPTLLPASPEQDDNIAKEASSTGTHYIPPHLRNRPTSSDSDSESQTKLKRRLKGLLNRLSEQNLAGILDSIEEVYRDHRRHGKSPSFLLCRTDWNLFSREDVTSTLTTLIIDSISSHSTLLDSYVVLYSAFVSSLHKIVGIEFGALSSLLPCIELIIASTAAFFVQNVVSSYTSHLKALSDVPSSEPEPQEKGKEASNLMVLFSELYNFQVISSVLVFDLIRDLLERPLEEFGVELLLKVVRSELFCFCVARSINGC